LGNEGWKEGRKAGWSEFLFVKYKNSQVDKQTFTYEKLNRIYTHIYRILVQVVLVVGSVKMKKEKSKETKSISLF